MSEETSAQRLRDANLGAVVTELDKSNHGDDKPFFLHVAYENPRIPLFLSDEYEEECKQPSRRGMYGDSVQRWMTVLARS